MSYTAERETSLQNSIFSTDEIFSYDETPYEQQFHSFYDFCRKNLDINSQVYSLNPNIFVYLNNFSVNAKAGIKNNYYIIGINSGLMIWGIQNLLMNEELNNFINNRFPGLLNYFDNSLDVLSFQLATQFTYYHELAHLIQLNNGEENLFNERIEFGCDYNVNKHWLELNADTFSAIAIASHIQQYLFNQIANDLDSEKANDCIIVFGTCLFSYIMSFASSSENIYFFDKTHPHPVIRVLNILMTLIHYLNQSPKFTDRDISFSYKQIIDSILNLHQSLEDENIVNDGVYQNLIESLARVPEIITYLQYFRELNPEQYNDAIEEWNKNIT